MRSAQTVACVAVLSSVATAWNPLEYQTYANSVISSVASIDTMSTTAWAYWAQTADHALIPLFKQIEKAGTNYTIALPTMAGFRTFTNSKGVNTSDLATLNSKGWKSTWADAYPYHFLKTAVNTTAVTSNETIILDSYKTSPAGDWPLQMVYYMDGIIKAKDVSTSSSSSSSSSSSNSTSSHSSSSSNSTTSSSGHRSKSSNTTSSAMSSASDDTATATDSAAASASSTAASTHNHKRGHGGKGGSTTSTVDKSGIFNGTFGDTFYGQYNVTVPDTTVGTFGLAQAVGGWVNEPKWLEDALTDLSINYTSLVALYPSFANLSTSRYTLFVPPADSIPTSNSSAFESFVGKHLVKSLVYSPKYGSGGLNLTSEDGSTIEWTDSGINGASVLHKDVLTNAMVLQLIDQAFTN